MTRGDILKEAHDIINSKYKTSDDENEFSFNLIADYWKVYLKSIGIDASSLKAENTQMMLALFKIAREALQKQPDNIRDCTGYLGLYADTTYPKEESKEESPEEYTFKRLLGLDPKKCFRQPYKAKEENESLEYKYEQLYDDDDYK